MKLPFEINISSLPCIDDCRGRRKTIIMYPVIFGIYKITSPKGAIYIGLSTDIYYRIYSCYKKLRCKQQKKIYNSLKKYGIEKHKFELIYIVEKGELTKSEIIKELNRLEVFYIKKFNSFSGDNYKFGLNLTRGGDSMELTKKSRKAIGDKNRGREHTQETKEKISAFHKGKPLKKEHKEKISKSHKGKKHTKKHRENNSKAHKGKKQSQATILKKTGKKQTKRHIAKRVAKTSGDNHWIRKRGGHTQKTKDKISKTLTGKMVGDKNPAYGKPKSLKTKKKISDKLKGRKRTKASRKKQGDSIRGEKHHNFGKKASVKTRKKQSESHKGIKPSKKSLKKRSKSLKLAWAKRKKEGNYGNSKKRKKK